MSVCANTHSSIALNKQIVDLYKDTLTVLCLI